MYSIIVNRQIVEQTEDFAKACNIACEASKVKNGGIIRDGVRGSIASVWSGPIDNGRGITKHVVYACGIIM